MRTLLVGALVANLVGCSHQPPPAPTAADFCASRNPLACWMSVRLSIGPSTAQHNDAKMVTGIMQHEFLKSTVVLARTARSRSGRSESGWERVEVGN